MRLINFHCIHYYQLLIIVLIVTIISFQLINCNQTDSSLTLFSSFSHHNQTLMVNQSCNQSDTNMKTITRSNLTVNQDSNIDNSNNLTGKQSTTTRNNSNQSDLNINYNNYSNSRVENQSKQSESTTVTKDQQSTRTIKSEKLIIRLKRARGRKQNFGSDERAKAQNAGKSSAQSTINHQQLALKINYLSLGLAIETLLLIKQQLNQLNL